MRCLDLAAVIELATVLLLLPHAQDKVKPIESRHRQGSHGLSGWTLSETAPGDESQGPMPFTLVISRDGHTLRSIKGDPFVWQWMFLADGKQVAYQTGPLHFSLECVLLDVRSGKERARYDCFKDPLPASAPAWVKQLEKDSQPKP